jgi:hypothetical protein
MRWETLNPRPRFFLLAQKENVARYRAPTIPFFFSCELWVSLKKILKKVDFLLGGGWLGEKFDHLDNF